MVLEPDGTLTTTLKTSPSTCHTLPGTCIKETLLYPIYRLENKAQSSEEAQPQEAELTPPHQPACAQRCFFTMP